MAMLASKSPYPAPHSASAQQPSSTTQYPSLASYRIQSSSTKDHHGFFASPTESEFSDHYDGAPDAIKYVGSPSLAAGLGTDRSRNWDEDSVTDWLRAIDGCAQYADLFKRKPPPAPLAAEPAPKRRPGNNINGENLIEMDHTHLRDMGIKKMGHRLRISTEVKKLRNRQFKKTSLQQSNRVCCALLAHKQSPPC